MKHEKKLIGILNGIDEEYWDPAKDPLLIKRYDTKHVTSREKLQAVLDAKAEHRRQLQIHFNLRTGDYPLVGSITRLVPQKGPELLLYGLKKTLEKGGEFVMLGSDHGSAIEKSFLPWNGREQKVGISIDYNESLSHLIFAGADMMLIPSRFEPCGLTQLISLRYGTVPIVRRTGGLADTVFDIDTSDRPEEERNGFTFDYFDAGGIDWALGRALNCWANDRPKWEKIMLNGMRKDFSWEESATTYLEAYQALLSKKEKAA